MAATIVNFDEVAGGTVLSTLTAPSPIKPVQLLPPPLLHSHSLAVFHFFDRNCQFVFSPTRLFCFFHVVGFAEEPNLHL